MKCWLLLLYWKTRLNCSSAEYRIRLKCQVLLLDIASTTSYSKLSFSKWIASSSGETMPCERWITFSIKHSVRKESKICFELWPSKTLCTTFCTRALCSLDLIVYLWTSTLISNFKLRWLIGLFRRSSIREVTLKASSCKLCGIVLNKVGKRSSSYSLWGS